MAYTGKKPIDHTDVTQSQSMTVTDDLTVDGTTLHVDSTNNKVGIGTTSPTADLHLSGSGARKIDVTDTGGASTRFSVSGSNAFLGTTTNNPQLFITNDAERMRIDTSGNVGIGTTSPSKSLHVYHPTTNKPALIESGDAFSLLEFKDSSTTNVPAIGADGNNIIIQTGSSGSERMRIDSSGNVLFAATALPTNGGAYLQGSSGFLRLSRSGTGTESMIQFWRGGSQRGSITVGTTTSYNTSSDYRLKENVTGITDGIERVKQLNPSRFNFIADADTTVDGFLAHEAATVVPEAVTGEKDAVDEDGNPDYQGIDQAKLVPLLTAALQEAIEKIETLEAQNADFEARLTALEAE